MLLCTQDQVFVIETTMENYLNWRGFAYMKLDGGTKADNHGDPTEEVQ